MNALDSSPAAAQLSAARLSQQPNLPNLNGVDMKRMRETAEDFESVFLTEMLRPMFENIEASAPFGGGAGEKIYRDMQVDEYGKALSRSGGIGLADSIMREMIKMQEGK